MNTGLIASLPDTCDGKEQEAFEAWASAEKMNMQIHPLHYLFLNGETYAARQAWKAAILYCRKQVEAAGASPVQRLDSSATEQGAKTQADAHLRALLRYTENFYGSAIEHGMKAGPTADAISHVERAAKALHQLVHTWAEVSASRASPVQPKRTPTYSSTQATMCAGCGEHKHTPLRIDAMGGYVCLTCIDQKLGSLLGEFGYPDAQPSQAGELSDEEAAALLRFNETCEDGEGYDVPSPMMARLSQIGVTGRKYGSLYFITECGNRAIAAINAKESGK